MLQLGEQIIRNVGEIRERVAKAAVFSGRNPSEIGIMAVTKTVPPEVVNIAAETGIGLFGENRVQEYLDKRDAYRLKGGEIHFIGHLQTNKVKYIIDKVDMIESVSSMKLAEEIEVRAAAVHRVMPVLLEVNISGEESKSGFSPEELVESAIKIAEMEHLALSGVMCIPRPGNGAEDFPATRALFEGIRARVPDPMRFCVLSMGMSSDYEEAVRCGSTQVRLGTAIFGARS